MGVAHGASEKNDYFNDIAVLNSNEHLKHNKISTVQCLLLCKSIRYICNNKIMTGNKQ